MIVLNFVFVQVLIDIFSNLIMYLRPAISKAIEPKTEATKVANSAAGIIQYARNAHSLDLANW